MTKLTFSLGYQSASNKGDNVIYLYFVWVLPWSAAAVILSFTGWINNGLDLGLAEGRGEELRDEWMLGISVTFGL